MMHSFFSAHQQNDWRIYVLILVVMDDALVLRHMISTPQRITVLILVVMDDALVLSAILKQKELGFVGLNPCCNG